MNKAMYEYTILLKLFLRQKASRNMVLEICYIYNSENNVSLNSFETSVCVCWGGWGGI